MENYRPIQVQDYGILRKKDGKEEELFVFGYSCKIYEDYDKSLYIDQGKHLIPWLGDDTLKIDRYDCRGALNDLNPYLPKSDDFDRRACLSNEEKRIETLCDEERFRALNVNEEDEILYQEEELKRLQRALNSENSYSEVGFNYDDHGKCTQESDNKDNEDDESEPFIPPYQLDVPVGMKIPKSRKHHEIIERTAFFINDQGTQMEILLKMKQAENPQFNFLSYDNDLHPYYRHMLTAIKNQRYKQPSSVPTKEPDSPQESASEDTYLHPSLLKNSTSVSLPESAPTIPNINYKPSVNCSYSALVNRIKESQNAGRDLSLLDNLEKKNRPGLVNPTYNPNCEDGNSLIGDSNAEHSNLDSLPLSALTKSARRRRIRKEKSKAAAASFRLYYSDEPAVNQTDDSLHNSSSASDEPTGSESGITSVETVLATKSAPGPVPAPAAVVQIPPTDIQLIVDKMASYVAKNGRDFEEIVKAKGDPRFSFLNNDHEYNPYYNQKVQLYLQLENPNLIPPHQPADSKSKQNYKSTDSTKKMLSKCLKSSKSSKPIPVCFSIKKPKDQEALEIRSALPDEEGEREENEDNNVDAQKNIERNIDAAVKSPPAAEFELLTPTLAEETTHVVDKPADMSLEKWAQERLKGKLVAAAKEKIAARERLAARERDKQLQAERRKRAADFISLLQKDNLVNKSSKPGEEANNCASANDKKDDSDVITIPSDSSSLSDTDSIVSVPLSSDEETKLKKLKRKLIDAETLPPKKKQHKDHSQDKERRRDYDKPKHRSHSSSITRSPSRSQRSSSKYDRDKRSSHSKKKKRDHYRSSSRKSSPSYRKKHRKSSHKSKRSKHLNDSEMSDSASSYDCVSELSKKAV